MKNKPVRLIELFAGYGSQAMAMKRLGIPFEHHFVCEFDKYAIASYNAVHGTDFSTVDIRDVKGSDLNITDTEEYTYMLTYSFPCQSLSIAGKQAGMSRGSGTRSGLLWEVERLLKEVEHLPQILIMENVPQVHSDKFMADFNEWISVLDSLGYKSKWRDLNAKEYGIPQNRIRTFMISVLDKSFDYKFPAPFKLDRRLRDLMDKQVDESYYLSDAALSKLTISNPAYIRATEPQVLSPNNFGHKAGDGLATRKRTITDIVPALQATPGTTQLSYVTEPTDDGLDNSNDNLIYFGNLSGKDRIGDGKNLSRNCPQLDRVWDSDGIGATVTASINPYYVEHKKDERNMKQQLCDSLIRENRVKEMDVIQHSYTASRMDDWDKKGVVANDMSPTLSTRCDTLGVVVKDEPSVVAGLGEKKSNGGTQWYQQDRVYDDNVAISVTTSFNPYYVESEQTRCIREIPLRIRKLTPKECFRLMGVTDDDADKMIAVNSSTQCYKQAGNSIVVDVLYHLFKNLFEPPKEGSADYLLGTPTQISLF